MCDHKSVSKKGQEKGRGGGEPNLNESTSQRAPNKSQPALRTPARGGSDAVAGQKKGTVQPSAMASAPSKVVSVMTKRVKAAKKRLAKMQREAQEGVQAQELVVEELEKLCGLVGAAVDDERDQRNQRNQRDQGEREAVKDSKANTDKSSPKSGAPKNTAKNATKSESPSSSIHINAKNVMSSANESNNEMNLMVERLQAENAALRKENAALVKTLSGAEARLKNQPTMMPTATQGITAESMNTNVTAMAVTEAIKKVVQLMYCACLFDPFVPYQVEKTAILSWMHDTQHVSSHRELPRFAEMLDAIGVLGKMMTRRPLGECKSHEESVRYCQDVALRYVLGGDDCVLGWSGFMTKAQVDGALGQVVMSEYFKNNEGLVYGGGDIDHNQPTEQLVHEPVRQTAPGAIPQMQDTTVVVGAKHRADVATPSLVEDQVGMPTENESTDGSSEREDIDVEAEIAHVAEPAVKRKSSGGKKKKGTIQTNHAVLPQRVR